MIHVGQMTRIGEGRSTETRVKEKESTVDTQAKAAKIASPRNLAASYFDHSEPIVTDLISSHDQSTHIRLIRNILRQPNL